MNKFRLKITGIVVVALAVIGVGYVLWLGGRRPVAKVAKPEYEIQLQKEETNVPNIALRNSFSPEDREARIDEVSKELRLPEEERYFIDPHTGQHTSQRFQGKLQARKTAPRPSEIPEELYYEQVSTGDEAKRIEFLKSLKSKKFVVRSRPGLPETSELKISEEQLKQMNEAALLHILNEYKDRPEQAEQVEKILRERLKHFHNESTDAGNDTSEEK